MGQTLYVDGFQRTRDPQQKPAGVKGQVQGHVSGDGGLRSGQEEVDGGLSGKPETSLLRFERAEVKKHYYVFFFFFCIITLTVPEAAVSRLPPEGNNEVLCPASAV